MRIAIYGAGATGTVLGAYITRAGNEVDLVNRNIAHIKALKKNGARITGTVDLTVPVRAFTPPHLSGKYDLIFLTTKQLNNEIVMRGLLPFMTPECVICTTQSGMPEKSIANIIGEDRVIGCAIAWGAKMAEPGVVELSTELRDAKFMIGRMNGKRDDMLLYVQSLLESMCPVIIEDNLVGLRWARLLINSAFSGMSAVLGMSFGEVLDDSKASTCVLNIIKECMACAQAAGVKIAPIEGKDVVQSLWFHNDIRKVVAMSMLKSHMESHRIPRASMLRDLEKGKLCEVEAINGVVCAYGKEFGIKTPYNDTVVAIIHSIEEGRGKIGYENIEKFKDLRK